MRNFRIAASPARTLPLTDDIDQLEALADKLFGSHFNIPPTYMRQLKRHLDTAEAYLGLVLGSNQRVVYRIDGRSLGVLGCTRIDDKDVERIGGKIRQLDHVLRADLTVAVHYNSSEQRASSGRRLTIGGPE